jgi:predicted permease
MNHLWSDVRCCSRRLRRRPAALIIVLLTVAFGVGASAAVFKVLTAVLFHQLPFAAPENLVAITNSSGLNTIERATFYDSARGLTTLEGVAEFHPSSANLVVGSRAQRIPLAEISASFFSILGVRTVLGRDFSPDEDQPGRDLVCLISYEIWQDLFSGNISVVGQSVNLNGISFRIIGVIPSGISFPQEAQIWLPTIFDSNGYVREGNVLHISALGRLRNGATARLVREELAGRDAQNVSGEHRATDSPAQVELLRAELASKLQPALLILNMAVGFVLLIVACNVGYFVLLQTVSRIYEIGLRTALGASTWRIVRERLTEVLILAFAGGLLGAILSNQMTAWLYRWGPQGLNAYRSTPLSWLVGLYVTAAILFTGMAAGLIPLWFVLRHSSLTPVRIEDVHQTSPVRGLYGKLVAGEMTLALVLLIMTVGSLSSLYTLNRKLFAYNTHGLLTFSFSPHGTQYADFKTHTVNVKAINDTYQKILTNLQALPDIAGVALTSRLSVVEPSDDVLPVTPEGGTMANIRGREFIVSPDYFLTMGLRVIEGRLPLGSEIQQEKLAVVGNSFAQQLWKNNSPIDKRLILPMHGPFYFRVIAVVADSYRPGQEMVGVPEIYLFNKQVYSPSATFILRTKRAPMAVLPLVKEVLATIAPEQPLFAAETLDQQIQSQEQNQRFAILVLAGFTTIALLLAVSGLYSAVSMDQQLRIREVGVRIALGAGRKTILKLMLFDVCRFTVPGILIGIAGGYFALRATSTVLFGFFAPSMLAISMISLLFIVTAFIPTFWPAKRAVNINPVDLLRVE